MISNVTIGSGTLSISVGVTSNPALYLAVTPVSLTDLSSSMIPVTLLSTAMATSSTSLRVVISLYTTVVATFTPRVSVMGMLYQTA
jgi:hypothetical protein